MTLFWIAIATGLWLMWLGREGRTTGGNNKFWMGLLLILGAVIAVLISDHNHYQQGE